MSGQIMPFQAQQLALHQAQLLASGKFSDFTIECQGHKFEVHRAMLTGRSPLLDAVLNGNFKESVDGCAKFLDDDKVDMAIMLFYIYTGNYPVDQDGIVWKEDVHQAFMAFMPPAVDAFLSPFVMHADMIAMADKFFLPGLFERAATGLRYEMHFSRIEMASDDTELREVLEILCRVADPAKLAEMLRAYIAFAIMERQDIEALDINAFAKLAEDFPKFAPALTRELMFNHAAPIWICASCGINSDSSKPSILVMASTKDATPTIDERFDWIKCSCRFRGFCRADERCRFAGADSSMIGFQDMFAGLMFCEDCAETPLIDWQYACGVQQTPFGGFKRITTIHQPLACCSVGVQVKEIRRLGY